MTTHLSSSIHQPPKEKTIILLTRQPPVTTSSDGSWFVILISVRLVNLLNMENKAHILATQLQALQSTSVSVVQRECPR